MFLGYRLLHGSLSKVNSLVNRGALMRCTGKPRNQNPYPFTTSATTNILPPT